MSVVDLQQLALRENEQTEWKENVADINDVVATLCAFANDLQNLGGGYVVCGAREESDPHGFPSAVFVGVTAKRLKEIENLVLARCRERVSPPITPLISEIEAAGDPSRRVLVFTQAATGTAHTFRRDHDGAKHYVRVSRSTLEARNGVLRALLVRKGVQEPWDRRPCPQATVEDLDLLTLRDTLNRLGLAEPPERYLSAELSLSAFVPPLLVRESLTDTLRPRNFALLLFGKQPQRFVPGAISFFSSYEGIDRTSDRGQRIELASTLLDQLRLLLPTVLAEARTLYDKSNLDQPTVSKYPERALREAVVNGLVHRDYELFDPLRVTAFADRIEINSPGGLPFGVSYPEFAAATTGPRWRNQTLAWFVSRLGYAEAEGQGLRTIARTMLATGCPSPEYTADDMHVVCTLRAHPRATQR